MSLKRSWLEARSLMQAVDTNSWAAGRRKTVETLRDKAFGGKCSLGPCRGRVCFTSIPFLSLSVSWALWGEQVFSTTWPNTGTEAMERVTVAQRLWDYEPAWNPSSFRKLVFCHGNRELTTPLSSQFCQKTHTFSHLNKMFQNGFWGSDHYYYMH